MKGVVFFDIDGTLVSGQTQDMLAKYLFKKRMINLLFALKIYIWFLLYKINLIKDVDVIMRKSYQLLRGKNILEVGSLLQDFFDYNIKDKIFPEAIRLINKHQRNGRAVVLISNTINPLVDLIKEYLNVDEGFGTELEKSNNFYTGNILGDVVYGTNKVKLLEKEMPRHNWDLNDSYAYSDNFSDLPLLKKVKNPVVVNPDSRMSKIAQNNNWSINKFHL